MPEDLIYPNEESETRLVNITEGSMDNMDFYIGSGHESFDMEPSDLRNPYKKSELGRDTAVRYHKMYFFRRYLEEEDFRKLVHSLEGKTLGCHCYPAKCHGEVIVDVLNEYSENGIEGVYTYIKNVLDEIDGEDLDTKGFKVYDEARDAIESQSKN